MAIAVTARAEQPLSQTELAQRLGVEGATMVAMVDRLAEAGLLVREASETDRRVNLVALTKAGNQLYSKVKAEADAFSKELLATIDKNKLAMAIELLEQLQIAVESAP